MQDSGAVEGFELRKSIKVGILELGAVVLSRPIELRRQKLRDGDDVPVGIYHFNHQVSQVIKIWPICAIGLSFPTQQWSLDTTGKDQ